MNELKRCPFCGMSPRTEVRVTKMCGTESQIDFSIHCTNCGIDKTVRLNITAYADFTDVNKAQAKVIEAWNQRTGEEKK